MSSSAGGSTSTTTSSKAATTGTGGTTTTVGTGGTGGVGGATVGTGGAGGGACVMDCATSITDPCPALCAGAPGEPFQMAYLTCAGAMCATECDNGSGMLKCGDMACGTCVQTKCSKEATDCTAN